MRDKQAIRRWLKLTKPGVIITAVHDEYCMMKKYLATIRSRALRPLVCIVDARQETRDTGVVQNLERMAHAIVQLVTSRVERADFGVPLCPQTILLAGTWRYFSAKEASLQ